MLVDPHRLGLEVTDLAATRAFYEGRLGLVAADAALGSRVDYRVGSGDAGATTLRFRRPTDTPRGGVHTHYAFSTTPAGGSTPTSRSRPPIPPARSRRCRRAAGSLTTTATR